MKSFLFWKTLLIISLLTIANRNTYAGSDHDDVLNYLSSKEASAKPQAFAQLYDSIIIDLPYNEGKSIFNSLKKYREDPDLWSIITRKETEFYCKNKECDIALIKLERVLDYFNSKNYLEQKCDILIWFGERYLHTGNYPKAFEYLLRADKELQKLGYENYREINEFLESISYAYYRFQDYGKSEHYLTKALDYPFTSFRNEINIYNNLALVCRDQKKDCTIEYLTHALNVAKENADTAWIGILSGNLGMEYYKDSNLVKADSLIQVDFIYSQETEQYNSAANSGNILAQIEINKKNYTRAHYYLRKVDSLPIFDDSYMVISDYFRAKSNLFRKEKNFKKALSYQDSFVIYRDSALRANDITVAKRAEQKINTEKHLAELKVLDTEYKKDIFVRNTLIMVAVSTILLLLILYRQYKLKRNKEKEVLLLSQKYTEEELSNAQHRLGKYILNIKEKNALIEKFNNDLETLKHEQGTELDSKKEEIKEQLIEYTLLTNEDWDEFKHLFDKVHKGYLKRLKSKYPELTFAETRVFVLLKLDLSVSEMASMLGISPNSVRKTMLRIRKKLTIEDQNDLIEIVQVI
ncbi:helix-turn-helix transcriptional regulator [Salibacter halophilus]|uniref:HTH luxR-type domain-containing protein n=1 Tax=Salibacter halophilus TaxID=1803916 RepID=A0A6N6M9H7_9FLAO|nr:sigma-70 region 4 domain-containing protein [Salibacter halophilus]KAB1065159.1 hypothetical protein F3059_04190 [Salibacter halophilus]